jgi:predicted acetyltransferase
MALRLEKVQAKDKSVLRRLVELYLYDFSEYDQADVNEHGLYEYEYIDNYWTEPGRHAFFFRVDEKLAGFGLVREIQEENRTVHSLAEFFVMRKYRRQKAGSHFAGMLFDLLPGWWHVAQEEANLPSRAFWRKVITEYTGGQYSEISLPGWAGPVQEFDSAAVQGKGESDAK